MSAFSMRINRQVIFQRRKIDETNIVIAVRGFKSPSPTAAFNGEPDFHSTIFFDPRERGFYEGSDRRHSEKVNREASSLATSLLGKQRDDQMTAGDLTGSRRHTSREGV